MTWILGVLLLSIVVGGMYLWGRTPPQSPRPQAPSSLRPVVTNREPMPVGNIPGWREVFSDSFNGRTLDLAKWRVYYGQPGGDPAGWFAPSHVAVSDGMLVISAYRDPSAGGKWATGGVSSSPGLAQTYGKYLVRFRFGPGVGIGHALVLEAASGAWPPEVDFSEDNGSGRDMTLATLHYSVANRRIAKATPVNLTQWHTLGVEWLPGTLRYTLDGRPWLTSRTSAVPSVPMVLDIQTQAWPCAGTWGRCPNATTPPVVRLDVAWVVAYAPTSLPHPALAHSSARTL
ncbi:MAG: glycoside hydrolase family 16 protein [Solirubrobacteraceae bacterium]